MAERERDVGGGGQGKWVRSTGLQTLSFCANWRHCLRLYVSECVCVCVCDPDNERALLCIHLI